jgi:hypothetical protein
LLRCRPTTTTEDDETVLLVDADAKAVVLPTTLADPAGLLERRPGYGGLGTLDDVEADAGGGTELDGHRSTVNLFEALVTAV